MRKQLVLIVLLFVSFGAQGQRILTSEGEVIAHGVSRTGVVPEALRQLLGARSWQVLDDGEKLVPPSAARPRGRRPRRGLALHLP